MPDLPHNIANGDAVDADELMANFNALNAALGAIKNADVADDAGIELKKLASRYSVYQEHIVLLPNSAGADYSSPTNFGPFGTSFAAVIPPWRMRVPSGKVLDLIEYELYVIAASGSPGIEFRLLFDGSVVGQTIALSTTGQYYSARNSNLFTAPYARIADQGEFQAQIRQDAAGSGTCRGLGLRLTFKSELTE